MQLKTDIEKQPHAGQQNEAQKNKETVLIKTRQDPDTKQFNVSTQNVFTRKLKKEYRKGETVDKMKGGNSTGGK